MGLPGWPQWATKPQKWLSNSGFKFLYFLNEIRTSRNLLSSMFTIQSRWLHYTEGLGSQDSLIQDNFWGLRLLFNHYSSFISVIYGELDGSGDKLDKLDLISKYLTLRKVAIWLSKNWHFFQKIWQAQEHGVKFIKRVYINFIANQSMHAESEKFNKNKLWKHFYLLKKNKKLVLFLCFDSYI